MTKTTRIVELPLAAVGSRLKGVIYVNPKHIVCMTELAPDVSRLLLDTHVDEGSGEVTIALPIKKLVKIIRNDEPYDTHE